MGIIKAICISSQRGTRKQAINCADFITNWGIKNDAHAGKWHRQVSLLAYEKIEEFKSRGAKVVPGDFGENLITAGIVFQELPIGARLVSGEVILELTQMGKECHAHCRIFKEMGECIMPREGVFAQVVRGGRVSVGDALNIEVPHADWQLTAAVITLSDQGSQGIRTDESGPLITRMLCGAGYKVVETKLLADEQKLIEAELIRLADKSAVNLIVTTGGTGFSDRDCTPEATLAVATRYCPGIAEAIRYGTMRYTKRAMLGRGVSVIRNHTLIVNLPGSSKAARESLAYILNELEHGIKILLGAGWECAGKFSL